MEQYLQEIYDDAFSTAYESFRSRRATDARFTRAYLRGLLESLYVAQGNNWLGRGEVKEAAQNGMIAAAEAVLDEWEEPSCGREPA
ncbi:MAG: phosphonoacetaldehyde reductase [Clostridiales bacterium]|nr:phosphonoacetaldehyde reductase [Clostridiales bacterium]